MKVSVNDDFALCVDSYCTPLHKDGCYYVSARTIVDNGGNIDEFLAKASMCNVKVVLKG